MARNKDIPRVQNPPAGDGHHVTWRYMTAAELAEREAGQNAYDAMLARQEAFERSREVAAKKPEAVRAGCVFAKSCKCGCVLGRTTTRKQGNKRNQPIQPGGLKNETRSRGL